MKNLLLLFIFILCAFDPDNAIDERIRQKVENLPVFKALNKEYEIFCIPSVREVYLRNEFNPFWSNEAKVNELIDIIKNCEAEGLHPEDYHLSDILEIKQVNSNETRANLDIICTDAFLLYCSHLLSGKTNPETIDPEWHVIKTDTNPVKYMFELNSKSLQAIISSLKPKNANYALLQDRLILFREQSAKEVSWKIQRGPVIRPGMDDNRIPQIREVLLLLKDYSEGKDMESTTYDESLKQSVIRFQQRHGLEALGTIGDQTIEMMNIPLEERMRTIVVNLERLRWLPQEVPNYYLTVNIVNFELDVVVDNVVMRNHKVIVGKEYRKTPVFSSTMQYLVLNPTWTVPPTILTKDVLPEVRKNKSYLTQKNIFVYNKSGNKLNIDSIDWRKDNVLDFTYRQEPGKSNALGAVKFIFPNKFNVYLHDTPSRELFDKTERAFSSGCIRVENPLELAEFLLRDKEGFSLKELQRIVETSKTVTVILKSLPEVYLLYLTTWVDNSGLINFRKDIYNRDQRLYNALQEKPEYDVK